MDPTTIGLIGMGLMLLLILLHVPIGVAMGVAGVATFGMIRGDLTPALTLFGTETVGKVGSTELAVIPLFLLMGSFATVGGLSSDLYRIAQELATNAARHAQPTGIGITLAREGKNLVLQVSNDGQSFDGNAGTSKGMGLHAVRKHLDALGGSLHFKPSPQLLGGTVAVCEIPLPSHPD